MNMILGAKINFALSSFLMMVNMNASANALQFPKITRRKIYSFLMEAETKSEL